MIRRAQFNGSIRVRAMKASRLALAFARSAIFRIAKSALSTPRNVVSRGFVFLPYFFDVIAFERKLLPECREMRSLFVTNLGI
jgi:hypothetical protein